ncbi:sensor histidine kinase [Streptomyces sp. NPDC017943]|uniref:sensor histidine kinase n=1 Tax=Streptomyces sp. NPDC017943 TaxID=3365019 RepID=UPI0037B642F4
MIDIPDLAVGGLALGTLSAFALGGGLLRSRRHVAALRATTASLRARLDGTSRMFTAEVEHLAERRVPAAARRTAHPHVAVPGPLNAQVAGSPVEAALQRVLEALHAELAAQRTRVDAAAQAGMRGATREIQAALYRLQDALRSLQQRYDDPELAQTLFALDHENEQSLRRAQVAAVVCGAWVGLARQESHLVDAVTGGQARLVGYERVRVHNHLEAGTALVSHAVEPVAIIVAELLDNALRHSAPDTDVVVNLEAVHHGVCVTVDDSGLGMTLDERARAQRMVAGGEPILLTDLGDPPRMGLAAVGQLTRQFDLSVDLSSPSPYGGVRAVLRVGSHLLTRIDPEEQPPAASAPRPTRRAAPGAARGGSGSPAGEEAGAGPAPAPGDDRPAAAGHDAPAAEHDASATGHDAPATGHEPAADGRGAADRHHGPAGTAVAPAAADHAYGTAPDDGTAAPAPGHHGPRDSGGLPQRRRRTRAADAPAASAPDPPRRRGPEESAAALAALQSGTAAARSAGGSNAGATGPVPEDAPPATTAGPASGGTGSDTCRTDTDTDTDGNDHEGGTAR